MATLYQVRFAAGLWIRAGALTTQGRAMLGVLEHAGDYGLQPSDYGVDALLQRVATLQAPYGSPAPGAEAVAWRELDQQLSVSALAFVNDLHSGRIDPRAAGFEWAPARGFDDIAVLARLGQAADLHAVLSGVEPQYIHYHLLEAALPRYRALAADPALTALAPLPARAVEIGQRYAGAPALRRLLSALGCLPVTPASGDPQVLDDALIQGLKRFQFLYGLRVDGILGPRTFAALATPLASRVRQIELTLERWRWLPPMQARTVIVNIPQFRLFAFESALDREQGMLRMDVIVGQEYPRTRTPVFMADMRTVVFRPYWDVPRSIVRHEILPALSRHPDYLSRQHIELVNGPMDSSPIVPPTPANLSALAAGRLRLRQRPGPDNALGLIKFLFPNVHNVYLHSTPAIQLFARARRTFSHGCIRVSDAVDLAVFVLQGTPGEWTRARIIATMSGAQTLRVPLARPVHVLILYGTALASEDGQLHFFDDIYGQDRRLQELLGLADPLPEPHAAGIHVHEIRPGIVSNTTAGQ